MILFRRKLANDANDKAHGHDLKHISHPELQSDPVPQRDPEPQDRKKEENVARKTVSNEEKQILFLRKLQQLSKDLGSTNKVMKSPSVLWTSDDMSMNSTPMLSSSSPPSPTLRATSLKKASVRSPLIENYACGDLLDVPSYSEDREAIDTTNSKIDNDAWEFRTESECLSDFVRSMFLQLGACKEGIFGPDVTSEEKLDTPLTSQSFLNDTLHDPKRTTQEIPIPTGYAAVAARIREHEELLREISLPKAFEMEKSEIMLSFEEDRLYEISTDIKTRKVQSQYPGNDAESSVFDSEWFTPEQPVRNRAENVDSGSVTSSISSRFSS
jgi:hypothetical protein